jgi:hypothetical protein
MHALQMLELVARMMVKLLFLAKKLFGSIDITMVKDKRDCGHVLTIVGYLIIGSICD